MRWNGFASSLVFAAAAALGWLVFAMLTLGTLPRFQAEPLYAVLSVGVYVFGIAPSASRGLVAALAAFGLGVPLLLLGWPDPVALGSAAILGVVRSGVLYRARTARALVTELMLVGGGLALAGFLSTPGGLGPALAAWGFYLVQSLFFLVGGVSERRPATPGLDPFELARARLATLLEED